MTEQAQINIEQEPMNPDFYKDLAATAISNSGTKGLDSLTGEAGRIEGEIGRIYVEQTTEADKRVAQAKENDNNNGANRLQDVEAAKIVAYAVKADVEAESEIKEKINKNTGYSYEEQSPVDVGPKVGPNSTRALELQRMAARLDFERNAKEATKAAQTIGRLSNRS